MASAGPGSRHRQLSTKLSPTDVLPFRGVAEAPDNEPVDKVARNITQDWLSRNERLIPIAILLVAGFTRFYRLDLPDGVACAWSV